MEELKNRFGWSNSRAQVFAECLRKYYYSYYGSWGGWGQGAEEQARLLYVLKQLKSRFMWSGLAVHDTIAGVLGRMKRGEPTPYEQAAEEHRVRMRAQWRHSRGRRYYQAPKDGALFEHEFEIPIPDARWRELVDDSVRCLGHFYESDLFGRIRATAASDWLTLENLDTFPFEGDPIHVVLDFAFREADGSVVIVDWKTGKNGGAANQMQLLCYGLYALRTWNVDLDRVKLLEANLFRPELKVHPLNADTLGQTAEFIRKSIAAMKAKLADPVENIARIEDFPACGDTRKCRNCSFQRVCVPQPGTC